VDITNASLAGKFSVFMMSSYLYYIRFMPILYDREYDMIASELLSKWDDFDHMHKHLVTKEDLSAGTLFSLSDEDYPNIVKGAADMWLRENEIGKVAGD